MKTTAAVALGVFGMVVETISGETNVVFRKSLNDGRAIEVREATAYYAVTTNRLGPHSYETSGPDGSIRYEMVVRTGDSNCVRVWAMDSDFISRGSEDDSRCHILDVAAREQIVAILYSRHVATFVDVVDVAATADKRSHTLCTTMNRGGVSAGQLAWLGEDLYSLLRVADTRPALFTINADGRCAQLAIDLGFAQTCPARLK